MPSICGNAPIFFRRADYVFVIDFDMRRERENGGAA
jgi:hypothetical protein